MTDAFEQRFVERTVGTLYGVSVSITLMVTAIAFSSGR
jgi:hypothetical protein